jgi:hypothetical protein
MSNQYLSANVNNPEDVEKTFYLPNGLSLATYASLFQQMFAAPDDGFTVIGQQLDSDLSDTIAPGIYKINSRWQVVYLDEENDRYIRETYKVRPITDLDAVEAQNFWQQGLINIIDTVFPAMSPNKYGYWKLTNTTTGPLSAFDPETTTPPLGKMAETPTGGKKTNFLPWIIAAAIIGSLI